MARPGRKKTLPDVLHLDRSNGAGGRQATRGCIPAFRATEVAESDSSQLLAKSSSTTGGIQEVEQTAPLRDGPAAWAWDF